MRVAIRSPRSRNRDQIALELSVDQRIDIVSERHGNPEIVLIDAGLVHGNGRQPLRLADNMHAIVVFAPNDPEELAYLLAAGARGYHRIGEPWGQLIDALHLVAAGGVRAEPQVMNQLLRYYRRLLHLANPGRINDS
ncbi:hypothetical protein BH23CHL2_BH23CHL2_27110 [soil metagenome]